MVQDTQHSGGCIRRINTFWRKLGVNVEAHIGRDGEIKSRLTSGLPHVKLPTYKIAAANAASGAFKERAHG